jgi:hypothetical protein
MCLVARRVRRLGGILVCSRLDGACLRAGYYHIRCTWVHVRTVLQAGA